MTWFLLALLAPFIWAIVVLIDDNLLRSVYKNVYFGPIVSGLFGGLPMLAVFFIPLTLPTISLIFVSIVAGLLTTFASFLYFQALQDQEPSITIAMSSMSPAFVAILAIFFLGEHFSFSKTLAFLLIFIPSFLLSLSNVKKFKIHKSFWLMSLFSFFIATAAVLMKYVYEQVAFWSGFFFLSFGIFLGAILIMLFTKEGRKFPNYIKKNIHHTGIFAISEILNIIALYLSHLAISLGSVSLTNVIDGIQAIYMLLIAMVLYPFFPKYFREAASGKKLFKFTIMGIMLIGLYLIGR